MAQEEFLNWKSQFVISNQPFVQTGNNLMSQFVTSSWGGTRKLPYAFTEFGVAMLSSVLNSDFYNPRITKKAKPPLISEGFFFT